MSYLPPCPARPTALARVLTTLGPGFDLFQKRVGICAQQTANLDELDDVQAAVRILDFRNERLRAAKLVRQLLLSHTGVVPGFDQKSDQGLVGRVVD